MKHETNDSRHDATTRSVFLRFAAAAAALLPFARSGGGGDGSSRRVRSRIPAALILALSFLGAPSTADAYRRHFDCWHLWDPEVWPPGETLVFYLSTINWPEDAVTTPHEVKDILNEQLGEFTAIPSADILWRVEGPVDDLQPGRDGKNIFYWNLGEWSSNYRFLEVDENGRCRSTVEYDLTLYHPERLKHFTADELRQDPWWARSHSLGHALGLGHAATWPTHKKCRLPAPSRTDSDSVWREWRSSCPNDLSYWRGVSGAWKRNPRMSYGIDTINTFTDAGGHLMLDDHIGVSLLRPKPGWIETTGAIEGVARVDGDPVPHIHVWALRQAEGGKVDGIGSFADENGVFRIEGLPPGDWFLLAHPDKEWDANSRFFLERQGDLRNVLLPFPVRARAGTVTGGIEIEMSRGRSRNLLPVLTR